MDFSHPNVEIGQKMPIGQLLFLGLTHKFYEQVFIMNSFQKPVYDTPEASIFIL